MANLGGGAEAHARLKQYDYRAILIWCKTLTSVLVIHTNLLENLKLVSVRQSKRLCLREESVLTDADDVVYKPKTKETRAAYEAMLSLIQEELGGQRLNIVSCAADEILAVLKNDTVKNPEKKMEIEKLLNSIPNQLVSIGKLITDFQEIGNFGGGNKDEGLDDDVGVAVEFEEDEEDDEESDLDMVQEEDYAYSATDVILCNSDKKNNRADNVL